MRSLIKPRIINTVKKTTREPINFRPNSPHRSQHIRKKNNTLIPTPPSRAAVRRSNYAPVLSISRQLRSNSPTITLARPVTPIPRTAIFQADIAPLWMAGALARAGAKNPRGENRPDGGARGVGGSTARGDSPVVVCCAALRFQYTNRHPPRASIVVCVARGALVFFFSCVGASCWSI